MAILYPILKDYGVFILTLQYLILTDAGCPTTWQDTTTKNGYNGFCYQFVNIEKYWADAQEYCFKYGGSLVMLRDSDTNNFITGVLSSLSWTNSGVWIGLNNKEDELKWKWATAIEGRYIAMEGSDWTNWAPGHPNTKLSYLYDLNCVRMVRRHNWKWHVTACSTLYWQYKFICQYEIEPTPARINPLPERQYLEESVRTSSTQKPSTVKVSPTSVKPDAVTSLDKNIVTRQNDDLLVEVVEIPVEKQNVVSATEKRNDRRVHIWSISGAFMGALLIIAIVVILMLLKRKNLTRDSAFNFCAKHWYNKSDSKTDASSSGRVDNTFVNPDPHHHTGSTKQVNADGIPERLHKNVYLVPRSLVDTPQAYPTTAKVRPNVRDVENKKVAVISEYEMDIKHAEVSQKDGDYEVIMDEPTYVEILEKDMRM